MQVYKLASWESTKLMIRSNNSTILSPGYHGLDDLALDFAIAAHRWRSLSANKLEWSDPKHADLLASAFLQYHAAKLALQDAGDEADIKLADFGRNPDVRLAA